MRLAGIEAKTVNAQLAPALAELEKKLPAGYTIEAGGTVEESVKGLRSIALIFPMMIFLMLTILMVQLQSFQKMQRLFITARSGGADLATCSGLGRLISVRAAAGYRSTLGALSWRRRGTRRSNARPSAG